MPKLSSKQVQGVENPATVLLVPAVLKDGAAWWSNEGVLLGGIQIEKGKSSKIMYLPTPVPRSWGQSEFHVCVEYEGTDKAKFRLNLLYGCGDPSELRMGTAGDIEGKSGEQRRVKFRLNPELIFRNQLFRCTLSVKNLIDGDGEVLIYGAWLEVGA